MKLLNYSFFILLFSVGIFSAQLKANNAYSTIPVSGAQWEHEDIEQQTNSVYYDTTQLYLYSGNRRFSITASFANTTIKVKTYRVNSTSLTRTVNAYLNGSQIYTGYQSWGPDDVVFDTTFTLNKGDVYEVECIDGESCM
ncbi:hypothetical protein KFE98_17465 [bacterium SCSIO 12741]|nr:hypothetical protein KFE98_17465 [bacterium SCSIO 12741]